jgi:hypothetical protein
VPAGGLCEHAARANASRAAAPNRVRDEFMS